jgi:uncharacterized membrane protein YdjX (TVP38/TMEM64 family)
VSVLRPRGRVRGERNPRLRLIALAVGIAAAALLIALTIGRSPDEVRDAVDGYGIAAPLVFIAVSSLLACGFFPWPLLMGASGLLFGVVAGTPVSIVAAVTGAGLAFLISRHVGAAAAEELAGPRLRVVKRWVESRGFIAVLYARLMPAMPFTVVNYAGGLTRLGLPVFLGATAIGVVPRAFAYTALGGSFGDLGSPEALVAIALLVGMAMVGGVLAWRERRAARAAAARRGPLTPSGSGTGSSSPDGRSAARP